MDAQFLAFRGKGWLMLSDKTSYFARPYVWGNKTNEDIESKVQCPCQFGNSPFWTLYQAPFLISVKLKFYSKSHQASKINVLQHITYSAWWKSIWSGNHLKSSPNLWVIARVLTWYWRFHKTFGKMIEIFNKDSRCCTFLFTYNHD